MKLPPVREHSGPIVCKTFASVKIKKTLMPDATTSIHSFTQPDGTKYILKLPAGWSPFKSQAFISMRNSIDRALLQISPFPKQLADAVRDEMREAVQTAADHALFSSVEPSIEIKSFQVGEVKGYYFSAQDRNPKPEEWPFMTQGFFSAQDRVISVTILTYIPPPEGTKEALASIAEKYISFLRINELPLVDQ